MSDSWALLLLITAVAAGGLVLAKKRRSQELDARVSRVKYKEGTLDIGLDVRGPVEDMHWLEPQPYGGPWDRRFWNEVRAGPPREPSSWCAYITITLRRKDMPVPIEVGVSRMGAPFSLLDGRTGLVYLTIADEKALRGALDSVRAEVSRVSVDGREVREAWADELQYELAQYCSAGDLVRMNKLIAELRSAPDRIPPRLVTAGYRAPRGGDVHRLFLGFYDEAGRVRAVRVRELTAGGQPLLCEDYELYPRNRRRMPFYDEPVFPIRARTAGQSKDHEAWAHYAATVDRPSDETLPAIWITPPSESRRVEISLVDADGNETERVPLLRMVGTR